MEDRKDSVTQLLAQARDGDAGALDAAYALVYQELKRVARSQLRNRGRAFETTVLVHEAFLRLTGGQAPELNDRHHLLAVAATAMRDVLVEHARHTQAQKRGSGQAPVTLADDIAAAPGLDLSDLLVIDELLRDLQQLDPRAAQVVELRCFGGYPVEEIAEILHVADYTVRRDWRKARAFLAAGLAT